jgi:hypothetical protein
MAEMEMCSTELQYAEFRVGDAYYDQRLVLFREP